MTIRDDYQPYLFVENLLVFGAHDYGDAFDVKSWPSRTTHHLFGT
jgi:hypothetical protein